MLSTSLYSLYIVVYIFIPNVLDENNFNYRKIFISNTFFYSIIFFSSIINDILLLL